MSPAYSFISSTVSGSSRIISENPWIPVSGVRNSWLTIETKSLFARLSRSSSSIVRRCCSNASAAVSAATTWSPKSARSLASSSLNRASSS